MNSIDNEPSDDEMHITDDTLRPGVAVDTDTDIAMHLQMRRVYVHAELGDDGCCKLCARDSQRGPDCKARNTATQIRVLSPGGKAGKASTHVYDLGKDGPAATTDAGSDRINPTEQEVSTESLGDAIHTKNYLVVGMIDAAEPKRFTNVEKGRLSEKKSQENKTEPVVVRPDHMYRVIVPITPKIQKDIKFYVACHINTDGLCVPRVCKHLDVIYLPEFWSFPKKVSMKNQVTRQSGVLNNIRWHAAIDKVKADLQPIPISTDTPQMTPHWVSPSADLAAEMHLRFSFGLENLGDITNALHGLKTSAPRAEFGPHTVADGVEAFLDYEADLDDVHCAQMISEIKVSDICSRDCGIEANVNTGC
jgi:hypothetical protein